MKSPERGPLGEPPQLPSGQTVPLSPAYAAGGLLFMSGQLPFRSDGSLETGAIEVQTRLCLENIERFLVGHGLDKHAIVKSTIWLVDVADFAGFNAEYAAFFEGKFPARSTVRSDLMLPGARVEIEVIAALEAAA